MNRLASALLMLVAGTVIAAADPNPRDYLVGQVSRDITAALERAKAEGKPVWIVAYDDKYKDAESMNLTKLMHFYSNTETRELISKNFAQIWAKMSDKEIAQWIDKDNKDHIPVFIVLGKDGNLVMRKQHLGNPKVGLQDAQEAVAKTK
jgi:hypothetical protein